MNLNELPGAELILPGIDDLHKGQNNTIGSLLIAIATTRLTEAGLDIPCGVVAWSNGAMGGDRTLLILE